MKRLVKIIAWFEDDKKKDALPQNQRRAYSSRLVSRAIMPMVSAWIQAESNFSWLSKVHVRKQKLVAIIYHHGDKKYLHRLLVHLKPLEKISPIILSL